MTIEIGEETAECLLVVFTCLIMGLIVILLWITGG